MKKAQAWQDTVSLLSGASPHRSIRPGEPFALPDDDLCQQPSRHSIVFRLYRQVSILLNHRQMKQAAPLAPFVDQPEYRYRKG